MQTGALQSVITRRQKDADSPTGPDKAQAGLNHTARTIADEDQGK